MANGWSFPACIAAGTVALAGLQISVARAADTTGPDASASMQALHRLLDAEWEWRLAQFPERATTIGEHRYDDRLTDRSPAAVAGRREHHRSGSPPSARSTVRACKARTACHGTFLPSMPSSTCA